VERDPHIASCLRELLQELISLVEKNVPETGPFRDISVGSTTETAGDFPESLHLNLVVMHMDERLNPAFAPMRFLTIRVRKSPGGGVSSTTCFHAPGEKLLKELIRESKDPEILVEKVLELASGLPEKTSRNLWR